jgi:ferric-dicitrate binding protein FerR (iron transport regulator)
MKHQAPNPDDVDHPDTVEFAHFQRLLQPYSVQARDLAKQMPDWHRQGVARHRAARYLRASAAVLALGMAACVGFLMLRLQWTPGAAWPVHGDRQQSQLQPSEPLITGPGEQVDISVARIGSLQLASNSALELLQTGPAEHRVRLLYGQMRARAFGHRPTGLVSASGRQKWWI